MDLKAGDVVMLKSGGQPLTVADVKQNEVLCLWMGMEGDLFRETLPLAVLVQVEEEHEEEDEEDEDEEQAPPKIAFRSARPAPVPVRPMSASLPITAQRRTSLNVAEGLKADLDVRGWRRI